LEKKRDSFKATSTQRQHEHLQIPVQGNNEAKLVVISWQPFIFFSAGKWTHFSDDNSFQLRLSLFMAWLWGLIQNQGSSMLWSFQEV